MNWFTWTMIALGLLLVVATVVSWRRPALHGWKSRNDRPVPVDAVGKTATSLGDGIGHAGFLG